VVCKIWDSQTDLRQGTSLHGVTLRFSKSTVCYGLLDPEDEGSAVFETSTITQPTTQLQIQEEFNLRVTWPRAGPSVCFGRRNHVSLRVHVIWFIALCLHTYIHTYIHIHIYTYTYTYITHTYIHTYIERPRAGRSGDRISVGARFSAPVQTDPGAHSAPYTMGNVSFTEVKRPGRGVDHPPSSAEVKERVELYLYSPPGPSWPVLGWTSLLTLPMPINWLSNTTLVLITMSKCSLDGQLLVPFLEAQECN